MRAVSEEAEPMRGIFTPVQGGAQRLKEKAEEGRRETRVLPVSEGCRERLPTRAQ